MKLLIAADIFPPQSGGPATYCVTLANELVKRGDVVEIVSLNLNSDRSFVSCILYLVSFKNKLLKYLQYTYLLWKYGKKADVIYAMGPVNAGLPALIVAKLRRKKFVVKVVGDYAWEQWQNKISDLRSKISDFVPPEKFFKQKVGLKIGILKWVERLVAQKADKVIVPSEYLKKIVIGWGVKSEKVEVIYNAIDFKAVDQIKHDGEKWLVSASRLVPWKGMGTLIEIMPELLKEFPDLRLKIIGGGSQMENYKLQITNYKLNDAVELLGELSHNETLIYIKSADVFVLNSGYEGLSHVILEALSFGRSVLASNIGGNPELLDKGHLFAYDDKQELANKILVALKNGVFQASNFELLKKFNLNNMVECTRNMLNNVTM